MDRLLIFVGSNVSIGIVRNRCHPYNQGHSTYSIVVGNNKFIGRRFDDATIDIIKISMVDVDFQFLTPRSRRELFASSLRSGFYSVDQFMCPILNE